MRPSEKAWLALAIGVLAYEALAEEDEMMSHAVDRWLVTRRIVTTGVIGATTLHLLNLLPELADPWQWAFLWRKWFRLHVR